MKDLLAAERYARALFEIARMLHKDEEIELELLNVSKAFKDDPAVEKFLNNPYLSKEEKRKFLLRLYQERKEAHYEVLLDFYSLLFEKNRFYLIHEIALSFKRIADEAQGQGMAEIRSAQALKPEFESRIVSNLERISGHKIEVKKEVDPSLIGGVYIKLKNRVIDGSVRNQIDEIKKELTKIRSI